MFLTKLASEDDEVDLIVVEVGLGVEVEVDFGNEVVFSVEDGFEETFVDAEVTKSNEVCFVIFSWGKVLTECCWILSFGISFETNGSCFNNWDNEFLNKLFKDNNEFEDSCDAKLLELKLFHKKRCEEPEEEKEKY